MSIIIVEPKKAAPEERGKEKVMAQKTASPYQTYCLTFQAPRPEKGGTNVHDSWFSSSLCEPAFTALFAFSGSLDEGMAVDLALAADVLL